MSQENAEVARRHQDAWNRRDLRTWLGFFRSDAEIDWSRARGPFKGVYRGPHEFEAFWDVFWSTFDDVQVELGKAAQCSASCVLSRLGMKAITRRPVTRAAAAVAL